MNQTPLEDQVQDALHRRVDPIQHSPLTVTDVRLSPDMATARVFVSILGTPEEQKTGLAALNKAAGYVRRQLAPRLRTKKTPNVVFALDDLLERGNRIENLLKEDEQ